MIRRMRPQLGTFVEVVLADANADPALADIAFAAISQIQQLASFHDVQSELSTLNQRPGQWLSLSRPLRRLLWLAQTLTLHTDQYFDCSVGRLMVEQHCLPAPASVIGVQARAAGAFLQWRGTEVMLTQPVWLVLDGIAKGFAVDWAVLALKAAGVKAGSVNAGGDIRVFGNFQMAVQIRHHGHLLGQLQLAQGAVATSGGNGGEQFPALLLEKSGRPVLGCFSVVAPYATLADAFTKVVAACPASRHAALLTPYKAQVLMSHSL